jgi:DNA-binding CsgD family transcriptional regulator
MLEEGYPRVEICRRLGLSPSVVSRIALRLGHRARPGPPTRFDWAAIRAFYAAGRTARECRDRFGFSPGAWDQAVSRGDVVPRPQRDPAKHSHRTRHAIAALLKAGLTQAAIARELDLSKGTVAFHVRNLGVEADTRFARRYDWEAVQRAHDAGLTTKQCCERFGFCAATWTQAVQRGAIVPRPRGLPLDELLVAGKRRGRENLKRRLLAAGLKQERCEGCGISEWLGRPISLELHHVNGDKHDNRIENLQLLCGNCHSQTHTWGGRNRRRAA